MTDADLPRCRNCFAVLGFITLTSGAKVPYTAPAAFQPRPTHAARKVGKAFVDGFVLRHAEQIPPGYQGFRIHKADCKTDTPPAPPRPPSPSLF